MLMNRLSLRHFVRLSALAGLALLPLASWARLAGQCR
jgi:hypothetical protein